MAKRAVDRALPGERDPLEEEVSQEAKFFKMLKLFEQGRISSGRAAEMCGMERVEFLLMAGRLGIPVADPDEGEIGREFD